MVCDGLCGLVGCVVVLLECEFVEFGGVGVYGIVLNVSCVMLVFEGGGCGI